MTEDDRVARVHVDGSRMFSRDRDTQAEEETAARLGEAWRCELRSFGCLAPIDWFAVRDGRLIGLLELKTRTHDSTRYPTVFLNLRKYLALQLGALGMGVAGIFVVRFTDGIWWTPVATIDATAVRMGGCRIVQGRNDVEPLIDVPVAGMHPVP